jgi:hypothetical protein
MVVTVVSVLSAARISQRKVERRLTRSGYTLAGEDDARRVSRTDADAVEISAVRPDELTPVSMDAARQLMGHSPSTGVRCRFDGAAGTGDAWATVVDIARAVAAEVPLAVLDDHAGTTYLISPQRGLIPPEEYNQRQGPPAAADFLRRLLGN